MLLAKQSKDPLNEYREFLPPLLIYQYHLINYSVADVFVLEVSKVLMVKNLLPLLRVKVLRYLLHNFLQHDHTNNSKNHVEEHQSCLEKYNYLVHQKFEIHHLMEHLCQQYPQLDHPQLTDLGFFHQMV